MRPQSDPRSEVRGRRRQITETQSDQVRTGLADDQLVALGLEPHAVRFYPNAGGLSRHNAGEPAAGLRHARRPGPLRRRAGEPGPFSPAPAAATADASGNAPLPQTGGNVQLTIDASLQLRLEKELYAAWVADRAPRVIGPRHGPIHRRDPRLGICAGLRREQLRGSRRRTRPTLFADPIVSQVYEPGSVMKMFTAAAALEEGVVTLEHADPGLEVTRLRQQRWSRTSTRRAWA